MSAVMIEVAENPLQLADRRLIGGAGSGKSTALAARAARLAALGRRVLVLSFNVTLANRLRSMVDAHARDLGANPTLVACANFHSFCTRVVQDAEILGAHLAAPPGMPWTVGIVAKATQAYEHGYGDRYDAVLVDEGQDFTPEWWDLLRHRVLADDGETLVAVDPTQDIYDRVEWLEAADGDSSSGFTLPGECVRLDESLRMPNDLLALSTNFAGTHLDGDAVVSTPIVAEDAGSVRADRRRARAGTRSRCRARGRSDAGGVSDAVARRRLVRLRLSPRRRGGRPGHRGGRYPGPPHLQSRSRCTPSPPQAPVLARCRRREGLHRAQPEGLAVSCGRPRDRCRRLAPVGSRTSQ